MSTTYDLNLRRRPATTRTWVALGMAATAVAVLVMIIAVACSGAGGAPPAAAGSPGPDASAGPAAEDTDTGDHPEQSSTGVGGQAPGNDSPGGQGSGGDDPGGDEPDGDDTGEVHPVFPIPITPTLSAEVYEPLPHAPCFGRGTIFVGGIVLAPIEVEYQWIKIGKFGLANEPLTGKMTVVFDEPGHKHVPALFPDSHVERAVQLHIYGAETTYSNPVAYPACP
jgi:hypothetical protein